MWFEWYLDFGDMNRFGKHEPVINQVWLRLQEEDDSCFCEDCNYLSGKGLYNLRVIILRHKAYISCCTVSSAHFSKHSALAWHYPVSFWSSSGTCDETREALRGSRRTQRCKTDTVQDKCLEPPSAPHILGLLPSPQGHARFSKCLFFSSCLFST